MKIAFISQPWNNVIPPVGAGSIAIWNYQVANRLAKKHMVTIYARRIRGQVRHEKRQGVLYRRVWIAPDLWGNKLFKRLIPKFEKKPFFGSILYYFFYILRVALDMRFSPSPPDIVHVNNLSQFVPVIRRFLPAAKIVLHMHCEWLTQLDQDLIASRLQQVDLILACSEHVVGKVRRSFPQYTDICHVIYNAVDGENFSPASQKPETREVRVLFVGRVSPEKGVHLLIDAFQKIHGKVPTAHLLIVGPNSVTPKDFLLGVGDETEVKKLRRFYQPGKFYLQILSEMCKSEIMQKISFVGPVSHDKLPELYRQADMLVNPSLSEAFGMSLVEAMACELPVLASYVGGMKEIVLHDQTGLFFTPDDSNSLAEALLTLLADKDLRASMGKAGRKRVLEKFTWDQITGTLDRYYRSIYPAGNRIDA